ncbi:helix-turn-helix domain-containing protein [Nocardia carnea]|uniref:Multiprotein-bridging factor 1 family protein n=1 Tax=Nocardia carnea TaxID=37328 RepID=A0ABW7TJL6_9NOCA|nr:helix-turn-helix transcriptional regulator [Nocardia carnea]
MSTQIGVGQRVAEMRKILGWSQPRLATEAHVSVSLVRAVEQGRAPASAAFVSSCARALKVAPAELLGQPYPRTNTEQSDVAAGIAVIRVELAAHDLPAPEIVVRPFAAIAAQVEQIRKHRRETNFYRLSSDLPALLTEVRALVHGTQGRERERGFLLLCELYTSSRSLAHKLGYTDLATLAVERMAWAASMAGSRLWTACAQFHRASVLTSAGDWNTATAYLDQCRGDLESDIDATDLESQISWGTLHLQSGLAAARSRNRDAADAHLTEAQSTATRVGTADFHDPVMNFGRTNTAIWSVGLAVEMLDGTKAIKRAENLILPPNTPKSRAGHLYIDLARAFLLHGDRAKTLDALNTARKIAPIQTRYHPMVHETVRVLARQEARSTESLRGFAAWCGVGQ